MVVNARLGHGKKSWRWPTHTAEQYWRSGSVFVHCSQTICCLHDLHIIVAQGGIDYSDLLQARGQGGLCTQHCYMWNGVFYYNNHLQDASQRKIFLMHMTAERKIYCFRKCLTIKVAGLIWLLHDLVVNYCLCLYVCVSESGDNRSTTFKNTNIKVICERSASYPQSPISPLSELLNQSPWQRPHLADCAPSASLPRLSWLAGSRMRASHVRRRLITQWSRGFRIQHTQCRL